MTIDNANTQESEPRVMLADQEHGGVRLLVPLLTLFACIGTYWIGIQLSSNLAVGNSSVMVIVLPVAIGIALGVAVGTDWLLKRYWPSGRSVRVDETSMTLHERNNHEITLEWDKHINVLSWRFTVPGRRGRVPKGWYCVACQLLQDEQSMTVYSFFSNKDAAEKLTYFEAFTPLISRKQLKKGGPGDRLLMREQNQLYAAETMRWDHGAELTTEDFADLVRTMGRRIESWPPMPGQAPAFVDDAADTPDKPPSKGEGAPIQL